MSKSYLTEAFKSLAMLNEEDFELNDDGIEEMQSVLSIHDDPIEIIDTEAETTADLEETHIGDAILDCVVCHSKLYKNPKDIIIDDAGEGSVVNYGEECPYCYSTDGFKLIGQIAPFEFEKETEVKVDDEVVDDDDEEKDVEVDVEEKEEKNESLKKKRLKESSYPDVYEYIERLQSRHHFNSAEEMIDFLGNEKLRALEDVYETDVEASIEEWFEWQNEDLDESLKKKLKEDFDVIWNKLPSAVKSDLNSFWDTNKNNKWFRPYLTALVTLDIISENDMIEILNSNIEDGFDDNLGESLKKNLKEGFYEGPSEAQKELFDLIDLYRLDLETVLEDLIVGQEYLSDDQIKEFIEYLIKEYDLEEDEEEVEESLKECKTLGSAKKKKSVKESFDGDKTVLSLVKKAVKENPKASGREIVEILVNGPDKEKVQGKIRDAKHAYKYVKEVNESFEDGEYKPGESRWVNGEWQEEPDYQVLAAEDEERNLEQKANEKILRTSKNPEELKAAIANTYNYYSNFGGPIGISMDMDELLDSENLPKENWLDNLSLEQLKKIGKKFLSIIKEYTNESLKEATLNEKNWTATISAGSDLRKAIEAEDYQGVLDGIKACYKEMFDKGVIDEDDYNSWTEDLNIYEVDDEDIEDSLDYELNNLYDACDNLNCWLALKESCNEELNDKPIKITGTNIDKYYNDPDGSIYYHFDDEQDDGVYDILMDFSIEDIRQGMKNGGKFYFHKGNEPHLTINEDVKHTETLVDDEGTEVVVDGKTPQEAEQKAKQLNQKLGNKMKTVAKNKVVDGKIQEEFEKVDIDTGDQVIHVSSENKEEQEPETDKEMIVPPTPELEAEVEDNTEEAEEDKEDNSTVDVDFDEFDEETFDTFGESYLKKVYNNVESYKTTDIKTKGSELVVEGVIKFKSGKEKKTSFIFEAKDMTKSGNARFVGRNESICNSKKAFTLTGKFDGGKFLAESFNYNYRAKDTNGKTTRLYGTFKK